MLSELLFSAGSPAQVVLSPGQLYPVCVACYSGGNCASEIATHGAVGVTNPENITLRRW